ncbi:MAG: DUF1614 domain-containing protein [Candidatus Thermoplasmatota archaeon]
MMSLSFKKTGFSMLFAVSNLIKIGILLLYILLPIIIFYLIYLVVTRAFQYMGFSSFEAFLIVVGSYILGVNWTIELFNFEITNIFANIHLFSYQNWDIGINTGGAIIPIALSLYLIWKNKHSLKYLVSGIAIVSLVTFLVAHPDPNVGIVSPYPLFLLPAIAASITSVVFLRKKFSKAAPFSYISGTLGVLIGADVFHLWQLISKPVESSTTAVIGGAIVFDMVFITGILAVIVDSILMYRQRIKEGFT